MIVFDETTVFADENLHDVDTSTLGLESTYDDYVRLLGGDGVLYQLEYYAVVYVWVDRDGRWLAGNFDPRTGKSHAGYSYEFQ